MADRPHGPDLLAIARETLRRDLLPEVSEDARYTALMIANAMAIAAREAEFGDGPMREAVERLSELLGPQKSQDAASFDRAFGRLSHLLGLANTEDMAALNKALVRRIRAGDFQPGTCEHASVAHHLWECALQQVRISNPKYLERLGLK
jgi:hypothetical protein